MQLNSNLDLDRLQEEFAEKKRLYIMDILTESSRNKLYKAISEEISYTNAFMFQNQFRKATDEELNALSNNNKNQLSQALVSDASKGVGFFYGTYKVTQEPETNPILKEFYEWLNSEELLAVIKNLTGKSSIVGANCQATRYKPGDYLTRHNDINPNEGRELAYVFNMTPKWHPDWGGLLQFFTQDGRNLESYAPVLNGLALFDVTHPHSVTYVTPFAQNTRLSVTGWFLNK